MRARAERLVLCGLVVLAAVACGGEERGGARLELFHLEAGVGPAGDEGELRCGHPRVCPGVVTQPAPREVRYEVLAEPGLGDDAVVHSTAAADGAVVSIALTEAGRTAFARLTRDVAHYGGRDQGWHHLAVVVGDEIVAFPEVDFDAFPDGIPDASSVQFAALDTGDARELVRRLRGG